MRASFCIAGLILTRGLSQAARRQSGLLRRPKIKRGRHAVQLPSKKTQTAVPNKPIRTLATQAPKVTGEFLQRVPMGFASFICDPVCAAFTDRLVGEHNDVARLISELRAGSVANHTSREQFKTWVVDIWLVRTVNPVKRGRAYWKRIASIVWSIYADTTDLRHRTKVAIKKETERLANGDKRKRKKMLAARARRKARRNGVVPA